MHLQMEFSMALSKDAHKRLVTGEDCRLVAADAIREFFEDTMNTELDRLMKRKWKKHGECGMDFSEFSGRVELTLPRGGNTSANWRRRKNRRFSLRSSNLTVAREGGTPWL